MEITVEQVEDLHAFMMGVNPDGVYVEPPLKLSSENAMTIIWFLQEHMGVLPDHYNLCVACGQFFDANRQGYYLSEDAIDGYIPEARWPTYENYCDEECLQDEIDRQASIIFMSFDALRYQLKNRKR